MTDSKNTQREDIRRRVEDLKNPPLISSGVWQCASRFMYERNPGDGALLGVVEVDPPDPKAKDGRITIRISPTESPKRFSAGDLVSAVHRHTMRLSYLGNNQFFSTSVRVADADGSQLIHEGVLTLRPDGKLESGRGWNPRRPSFPSDPNRESA